MWVSFSNFSVPPVILAGAYGVLSCSSYTGRVKLLTLGIVVQLITDADRKWAKSLESGRPLAGVSHLAL